MTEQQMKPRVQVLDDELLIEWPGFLIISVDDEGFGYAIRDGEKYRPGKFTTWPEAAKEIQGALRADTPKQDNSHG